MTKYYLHFHSGNSFEEFPLVPSYERHIMFVDKIFYQLSSFLCVGGNSRVPSTWKKMYEALGSMDAIS